MAKAREDATLAGRIRMGMAAAGLRTPAELARRMKINRQTVYRWTDGQGDKLTPEMLFKLSDALGVNPRWLALGPPETPVPPSQLDHETQELIQVRDALHNANPDAKDQWVSQGRDLVKLVAPKSIANPFPVKTK